MKTAALENITTLTFDCYGTLVDWRAGQKNFFENLFGALATDRLDELAAVYEETEATVEAGPYITYREVLAEVCLQFARKLAFELSPEQAAGLADSLPHWPLFEDTQEALARLKHRFRLGVLSNVDRDLFAETQKRLGIRFDFVITAQDVQTYKPAPGHFNAMLADHAKREEVLHVAQSLFHDGMPARKLDLAYVWINRYNDVNDSEVTPLATLPDLNTLANTLLGEDA